MGQAIQYHFEDFTFSRYRQLIQMAKSQYRFIRYEDWQQDSSGWAVLWRHDVDFSPENALKMAVIEQEEGVTATYFILLHSMFYNAFSMDIVQIIQEIIQRGHSIGLHFDPTVFQISDEETLSHYLTVEKNWLETMFNVPISAFSFHMTNAFTNSCRNFTYAGLINTYATEFQQPNVGYCSDSNGYWRFDRLQEVLQKAEHSRLQVLTHPVWWSETPKSIVERFEDCLSMRSHLNRQWYQDVVKTYNREYVDWEREQSHNFR